MKQRVELPINRNTYIRSNVSRASLFAVLSSDEYINEFEKVIADFYISHIQLSYTYDTMRIAPHFDMYERCFSDLLEISQVPMEFLDIKKRSIVEYFVQLIANGYYINLGLDEYYIPGRSFFQKRNFMHVNFMFGYDLEKKIFKIMGFDGKLVFSEIDFDNFFSAIQRQIGPATKINLYKYVAPSCRHEFCIDSAHVLLNAYLKGERKYAVSSTKLLLTEEKVLRFGLDIHRLLLQEEKHFQALKTDIRIVYQILEHNLVMAHMLEYLKKQNIIKAKGYNELKALYNEILTDSEQLKNLVLKNRIREMKNIDGMLRWLIQHLQEREHVAVQMLIDVL